MSTSQAIVQASQCKNTKKSKVLRAYDINMAQNYAEPKVLLQFPYPEIQVVWMKQMIPEATPKKGGEREGHNVKYK